jgi:hypothetical protein
VKAYGGMILWVHLFLTSALDKGDYSPHLLADRLSGKSPLGGWMGPTASVGALEKGCLLRFPLIEPRFIGRTAHSVVSGLYYPRC